MDKNGLYCIHSRLLDHINQLPILELEGPQPKWLRPWLEPSHTDLRSMLLSTELLSSLCSYGLLIAVGKITVASVQRMLSCQ